MAIVMMSDGGTDDIAQYDQVIEQLEAAGLGNPVGRLSHVAAPKANGGYFVVDVWESQEALDRFAEKLIPLISGVGGKPPALEISTVHNMITPA